MLTLMPYLSRPQQLASVLSLCSSPSLCRTCRDHNSWLRFSPCEAHRLQMLTLVPHLSRPQHRPRQRPATSSHNKKKKRPTLRSRSPCASWAPPPFGGLCGMCYWLSPHRTSLPVRAVQVTATPWLARQSSLSSPSCS